MKSPRVRSRSDGSRFPTSDRNTEKYSRGMDSKQFASDYSPSAGAKRIMLGRTPSILQELLSMSLFVFESQ